MSATSVVDWLIQAGEIAGWGPLTLGRAPEGTTRPGGVLGQLGPFSVYARDVPEALLHLLGFVAKDDKLAANLFRSSLEGGLE